MSNGTLADHLYKIKGSITNDDNGDDQQSRLTWEQRLNICIGAARGLDFLHRKAVPGVIHRDVKSSNILLDDNFVAKIADFGLAKLVKPTIDPKCTVVSTTIFKGTFGYMDPEYFYTQKLTTKTDIYAFGVVLLVVLSGRPAVNNKAIEDQRSLSEWAKKCIEKNKIDLIIDPYLVGKISSRSLKQFIKISLRCLHTQSERRPTMEEIVLGLELAREKQPTSGSSSSRNFVSALVAQMVAAKLQITMKKKPSASALLCPNFSLDEIKTFTRNFRKTLGKDRFGKVYKGYINNGEEVVAIERLRPRYTYMGQRCPSDSRFLGEIEMLCKIQNDSNVVRLKGYCNESPEMILVLEYMSKGSLKDHLLKRDDNQHRLTWEQRLYICLGVSRGLDYLHRVIVPGVIHCNIHCGNIMLDNNFEPKITGFSSAKQTDSEDLSDVIVGIYDYMAPEYALGRSVTRKIDVYSFGVVLLVVLSGRVNPFKTSSEYDGDNPLRFVEWAGKCIKDNRIDRLIDPDLRGQLKSECLEKYIEVAQNCLHVQPENRPTMEDVVSGLKFALGRQCSSTSTRWIESHGLPNLPRDDVIQEDVEHAHEGEYSLELYKEFMEEYYDI